jgi:glutamyl-tRNA synthetase
MLVSPSVTRFAPSPTGYLHLGNARTSLFNYLAARAGDGRMVIRIEDTDVGRSDERLLLAALEDLRWLGISWDEGPDVGGPNAPYRQSERGPRYAAAVASLEARRLAYPCFCTPEELELARRAQRASGRPPRYAGTCATLSPGEIRRRRDQGLRPAVRFRVTPGCNVEFDDRIHGRQHFRTDDIGDFVILRADGTAAFFLSNALDDAAMGVTLVLRGDDHLANTPRQILLLEALGLPVPEYGHLPLVLGPSGAPLSKREGAASLHELRAQGYLPAAVCNYLVRLGHACGSDAWIEPGELAARFDLDHVSRSPARFDEAQLRHWQREAVSRATSDALVAWLGSRLDALGSACRRAEFVAAVRGNLLFPSDAEPLVHVACDTEAPPDEAATAAIVAAGAPFFALAGSAWKAHAPDFKAWARAVGSASGRKGAELYLPLRASLTGMTHGPELAPLVAIIGPERVAARLAAAEARAGDG